MISTDQDDITTYVEAVRAALAGLPEATRDELIDDLPEHLAEVKADGAGSLTDRLGTPESYAAELRATAGFVGGFPDPPGQDYERLRELRDAAMTRLRRVDLKAGPLLGYARASEFLVLLRPAWWVLRGYLAAMLVAWALDDSSQPIGLLPRIGGSEVVAAMLLAGGVLASVWLGRRTATGLDKGPRLALHAASVVLILIAIGGFLNADSTTRDNNYNDVNHYTSNPYSDVRDVFVYDDQGRLVTNARLFDQDGQPIRLGDPYCSDSTGADISPPNGLSYPYCPSEAPFQVAPVGGPPASADPDSQPTGTVEPSAPTRVPSPSATPSLAPTRTK